MLALIAALLGPAAIGHASGADFHRTINSTPSGELCRAKLSGPHNAHSASIFYWLLGRADLGSSGAWVENWMAEFGLRSESITPPTVTANKANAGAALATTVNISVGPGNQLAFQPSVVTINVGDTVQWTFATSGHDVVSGSACIP